MASAAADAIKCPLSTRTRTGKSRGRRIGSNSVSVALSSSSSSRLLAVVVGVLIFLSACCQVLVFMELVVVQQQQQVESTSKLWQLLRVQRERQPAPQHSSPNVALESKSHAAALYWNYPRLVHSLPRRRDGGQEKRRYTYNNLSSTLEEEQQQQQQRAVEPMTTRVSRYGDGGGGAPEDPYKTQDPYHSQCTPMADWQTKSYPVCNKLHEMVFFDNNDNIKNDEDVHDDSSLFSNNNNISSSSTTTTAQHDTRLLGKGYWRTTWRIQDTTTTMSTTPTTTLAAAHNNIVAMKRMRWNQDFFSSYFRTRMEAMALEATSSSPHVINLFAFCGHSQVLELAEHGQLPEFLQRQRRQEEKKKEKQQPSTTNNLSKEDHDDDGDNYYYLQRLEIARDLAQGLADIHYAGAAGAAAVRFDDDDHHAQPLLRPTMAIQDIDLDNVIVAKNGKVKWHDFNDGVLLRWNKTTGSLCHYQREHTDTRLAPEVNTLTANPSLVDVYIFSNILMYLLTGHELWYNPDETQDEDEDEDDESQFSLSEIRQKQARGEAPFIPPALYQDTSNIAVQALIAAILAACQAIPSQRLNSLELSQALSTALQWAKKKKKNDRERTRGPSQNNDTKVSVVSEIQQLFTKNGRTQLQRLQAQQQTARQ